MVLTGPRAGQAPVLQVAEGGPDVAGDDRAATGLKVDRYGRLFVSGADSKHIRVYDARTGSQLRDYFAGADAGFINDVVVTKAATRTAYKRKGVGKEEVRSKNPLKASKKAAAGRG